MPKNLLGHYQGNCAWCMCAPKWAFIFHLHIKRDHGLKKIVEGPKDNGSGVALRVTLHYGHGRDHEIVRAIETHPKVVP